MSSLGRISYGRPWPFSARAQLFSAHNLNDSTSGVSWVFQAPVAGTITRVGFNYYLRTGTPPTYRASLQGVSLTTGVEDGTIKGGGSPASVTFTPPASTAWDGTFQWLTLANSYTCTRGELLALVIGYSSGTVNSSNFSQINYNQAIGDGELFPYPVTNKTGTKTIQPSGWPVFGIAMGTTAYGNPVQTIATNSFNSGSTPDEYACAFSIPGTGGTFKLAGVRLGGGPGTLGTNTAKMILYSGTTALQEITHTGIVANATSNGWLDVYFTDTTLQTLSTGTTYRIGLQPQSGTSWYWYTLNLASANDLSAFAGGSSFYLSTRTDAGSWSDDTTKRPLMELILDDLTLPTAGALMFHPGMDGGMAG